MEQRLDIHQQIKGYYSIFFSGKYELRPIHTSLYMFLLNQNNRNMWVEWFKCPYDLGMQGSGIHSKKTYYKTLSDLQACNLIEYQKGVNDYKAPKIKIINLSRVVNLIPLSEPLTTPLPAPLSEPLYTPLTIPLSGPLSSNIIRLITCNFKLITDNIETIIEIFSKNNLPKTINRGKPINPDKEYKPTSEFNPNTDDIDLILADKKTPALENKIKTEANYTYEKFMSVYPRKTKDRNVIVSEWQKLQWYIKKFIIDSAIENYHKSLENKQFMASPEDFLTLKIWDNRNFGDNIHYPDRCHKQSENWETLEKLFRENGLPKFERIPTL